MSPSKTGGSKPKSQAAGADRHVLYERAVQDPRNDAKTLAKLYRRYRKSAPKIMREDFCGTATLATHWAKARPDHRSIGVDLDVATLTWGQRHNVDAAGADVAPRVELIHGNVLDGLGRKADIVCA